MNRIKKILFISKKSLDKPGRLCYTIIRKNKKGNEKKMKYIQNIQCGNIFPYTRKCMEEAMNEAAELYDRDDYTNACEFWEYYEIIEA